MKKPCKRISTSQLAERWNLSEKTLRNMRCSGKGPFFIKLGKAKNSTVVYRLKDITSFEKANLVSSTSQHRVMRESGE